MVKNYQKHMKELSIRCSHGVLQCTALVFLETKISNRIGVRFLDQSRRPPHLTLSCHQPELFWLVRVAKVPSPYSSLFLIVQPCGFLFLPQILGTLFRTYNIVVSVQPLYCKCLTSASSCILQSVLGQTSL